MRICQLLFLCSTSVLATVAAGAEEVDFREKVAPILERRCLQCHDGEHAKGKLSLATAKTALAGGESGTVIDPGKPDESLLVEYISGDKPEMPKEGPPLAADEVKIIRRWIAAGAKWPQEAELIDRREIEGDWWSLRPLARPSVPKVDSSWVRNNIDAFILAEQMKRGLSPSAEADRRTLIRRLTYNLHGLPPTPAEIEAFERDDAPGAYERLVDRLLDSPRYGERWGRHWLDVVHFGESHGYDKDKPRPNAWPYRDYVIASLNADKPYDRFILEQLAGDVLFPNDAAATVATGFIAAGPWDFVGHVELREGTTDKDIARSNDRDDMVTTTMSTFCSLTVHCARCHNHKFDPIKQEDYYRLQAVFAGVDRADRPYESDASVAARRRDLASRRSELAAREKALAAQVDAASSPEISAGLRRAAELASRIKSTADKRPAPNRTLGYHSNIEKSADIVKWVTVDLGQASPVSHVVLAAAHEVYGGHPGPGFGFPVRFKVELALDAEFKTGLVVLADYTGEDFSNPGDTPLVVEAATPTHARYVRVTATKLWPRTADYCFALSELAVLARGQNVAQGRAVTALDSIEAGRSWGRAHLVDGFYALTSFQSDGFDSRRPLETSADAVQTLVDRWAHQRELRRVERQIKELREKTIDSAVLAELAEVRASLATVQSVAAALPPPGKIYAGAAAFSTDGNFSAARALRPIHLLARGNVRSPKQLMAAGSVACVAGPSHEFDLKQPDDEGARRAALAHWLADPTNALVRRSIVNRVWHYHFGQGLVDTPNDFGRMGSLPSHPELLEWLAGWFLDQGQSLKKLHRLIVTSATYRQSSRGRADFERIDSGNRYLWRMNRTRLDAECVRDAMLLATGKLDTKMGGPSVQQFNFKDDHSPVYDYQKFDVDDPRAYRRSVYRFIVRSVPDPFMDCMDCADASILTPKRNTTITAIQALAMLNNRFVLRQAEHLAERARPMAADVAGQVEAAFRLALGRRPSATERAALVPYAQTSGLANACRVIFNSNEFLFVD